MRDNQNTFSPIVISRNVHDSGILNQRTSPVFPVPMEMHKYRLYGLECVPYPGFKQSN